MLFFIGIILLVVLVGFVIAVFAAATIFLFLVSLGIMIGISVAVAAAVMAMTDSTALGIFAGVATFIGCIVVFNKANIGKAPVPAEAVLTTPPQVSAPSAPQPLPPSTSQPPRQPSMQESHAASVSVAGPAVSNFYGDIENLKGIRAWGNRGKAKSGTEAEQFGSPLHKSIYLYDEEALKGHLENADYLDRESDAGEIPLEVALKVRKFLAARLILERMRAHGIGVKDGYLAAAQGIVDRVTG